MSLKTLPIPPVPEETASVVRAIFPLSSELPACSGCERPPRHPASSFLRPIARPALVEPLVPGKHGVP